MKEKILVEVSARHIHLSAADLAVLFGEGHQLTVKKELSQPGQYACEEKVTLRGPKGEMKLSVLGPTRKETQVELSLTDARTVGVKALVRESGDIAGSAPITIIGPKGTVTLKEGCIIANRHIHMSEEEGAAFGLKDGAYVTVDVEGARRTTFYDVQVRVNKAFRLEMHIDTDDANAAGIGNGAKVKVIK